MALLLNYSEIVNGKYHVDEIHSGAEKKFHIIVC